MPVTNLKRVQFGKEVTWGTAVAATALLSGAGEGCGLEVVDETYHGPHQGSMGPSALVAEVRQHAEPKLEYDLTYEDICFLWDGLFGACSPTGGPVYVWPYTAPLATAPVPRPYTMEIGALGAPYKAAGVVFNKTKVEGDIDGDGVWKASVDLLAKVASVVVMASLSARVTEMIRMADTALYVDAWAGTMGATAAPTTLISFALDLDPKYHLKWFAGSVAPGAKGEDQWEGSLELVLEFNATAKAYVDALLAPALVQRQIRLKAASGTKIAQIDFAGTLVKGVKLWEDRDGNMTISTTWEGTYNATFANWLAASVSNAVASLP